MQGLLINTARIEAGEKPLRVVGGIGITLFLDALGKLLVVTLREMKYYVTRNI